MTGTRTFPQLSDPFKTSVWDPAEHLESEEDIAAYLGAAFEKGDPPLIAAALGDVCDARENAQIVLAAIIEREKRLACGSKDFLVTTPHKSP
jgi:probable addiction module antidote protein